MTQPNSAQRLSLNGFAKERAALVREMEDHGWRGRLTSNGHAFMLAPDGELTCSVTPKTGSPTRADANSRMVFRRWLKAQQPQPQPQPAPAIRPAISAPQVAARPAPAAPVDTAEPVAAAAAEPVAAAETCPICDRSFRTRQALSVHHVRAHVRVACPICDRQLPPGNLPRHERVHRAELGEDTLRSLYLAQRELAQLREEVSGWQALAEESEARAVAAEARFEAVQRDILAALGR